MLKKVGKWFTEGNDCERCCALWESRGYDDCDCGCRIKGSCYEDKPCRLPKFIIWIRNRRLVYFENHQWDGFEKTVGAYEADVEKIEATFDFTLGDYVLGWYDDDGGFHQCDKFFILGGLARNVKDELTPKWTPPPKLRSCWWSVLKDTLGYIPNKIKPYVCK